MLLRLSLETPSDTGKDNEHRKSPQSTFRSFPESQQANIDFD